ncbi:hypothetical protein [Neobacillus niacini]|uniref:hypothetical protein n=1 Tax=Neobacillus niacini TaxID=86668 RepID=UPI003983A126
MIVAAEKKETTIMVKRKTMIAIVAIMKKSKTITTNASNAGILAVYLDADAGNVKREVSI